MRVAAGDRVCALTSERDVFRRSGVVVRERGDGTALVSLDAGGVELIPVDVVGQVVEDERGSRRVERFRCAGWYRVVSTEVEA
jgi:hypothetical protein